MYKDFTNLNEAVRQFYTTPQEDSMNRILVSLSNLRSTIKILASKWANAYSAIQLLKYSESGDPEDVTTQEAISSANSIISDCKQAWNSDRTIIDSLNSNIPVTIPAVTQAELIQAFNISTGSVTFIIPISANKYLGLTVGKDIPITTITLTIPNNQFPPVIPSGSSEGKYFTIKHTDSYNILSASTILGTTTRLYSLTVVIRGAGITNGVWHASSIEIYEDCRPEIYDVSSIEVPIGQTITLGVSGPSLTQMSNDTHDFGNISTPSSRKLLDFIGVQQSLDRVDRALTQL